MRKLLISVMALALCRASGSENEAGGGEQTGTNTGSGANTSAGQAQESRSPAATGVENFAAGNTQGPTQNADAQKQMQQEGTVDAGKGEGSEG